MTGGSDDVRTPDDEPTAVESAWEALVDGAEAAAADHPGHSGRRPVPGRPTAVGRDRTAEPEAEMERLMLGEITPRPGGVPDPDAGPSPVVTATVDPATEPAPDHPTADHAATEPAAAVPPEIASPAARDQARPPHGSPAEPVAAPLAFPEPRAPAPRESSDGKNESAVRLRPELRVVARDEPPPRASRPVPPIRAEPPASSIPWGLLGVGAVVVGAAVFFGLRDDDKEPRSSPVASAPRPGTETKRTVGAHDADDRRRAGPDVGAHDSSTTASADESDGSSGGGDRSPHPHGVDPRLPPRGTAPEAAAAFMRLPVSPSDRPPVGGVGAGGIHIDHIDVGAQVEDGTCRGQSNDFSVERGEHVSVCVRVVHQREKEELQVLWQKHGGSTRRSKMLVQPRHAYRTRGYLKLRKEYIGDWTVRILSSDEVELARHDFTVVP